MTAPSTTPGRAYQGYPYSNPLVIDVPSIDPVTASSWANLPRNPIIPGQNTSRLNPDIRMENRDNRSSETNSNFHQRDTSNVKLELDVAEYPVVYIDFPTNEMGEYVGDDNRREDSGILSSNQRNDQSNFVQDTIFYDPFEDRRIDVVQNQPTTSRSIAAETESLADLSPPPPEQAGSSGLGGSSSPSSHSGHAFRSKEAEVYNPRPRVDDNFLQSTIPASQFPAPPPAYTEIDRTSEQPPPPRTEVIIPENTCPDRKLVSCNFCGQRVYTVAIKQNGAFTHVLACFFIFVFAPIAIIIYCSDCFKYKNHYCPNCNKHVGYEVPILCQGMVYTKSS